MQSRLLIINCPSDYFVHVPMGTFGLCDYLNQKNIQVRILNLSLYDMATSEGVLEQYLNLFHPTHICLVFHWQETVEGFLWVGEYIKYHFSHLKIISGGFTAGYFAENLLERCWFMDYVIKGDPEKPLELLLKGTDLSEIPNLIYKESTEILSQKVSYHTDQETLSGISFCDLTYLYDYELYIKVVEKKFGFPLFIGKGCEFSCRYCGGSRDSFKLHSGRVIPIVRSIDSIISDLKRLKNFTRKIYICYENDRGYVKKLFEAMKEERSLVKTFQLNYGTWQLYDKEFLKHYKDLFIVDKNSMPIFELSPEVFDDSRRKKIKHQTVFYSLKDLKTNLSLVKNCLDDTVRVSIFFSRYHDTHKTYPDMKKEITGIVQLKHDLFRRDFMNARVQYDHLSTDVASKYWERYVKNSHDFDTLVSAARKLKAQEHYSFPVNNFCIYIPETLSEEDIFKCELLISILKILENYFFELFHILFKCLDDLAIDVIEEIITEEFTKRPGNIFTTLDESELLISINKIITRKESLHTRIPFIEDIISLCLKKALYRQRLQPHRNSYKTSKPKINHAFISVNDHDYLDLQNFLEKMEREGFVNMTPEKTVFIFLVDEILSMPYLTYRGTLNEFEKGISLDDYYILMKKREIFDLPYHKKLIAKLFKSNVLY